MRPGAAACTHSVGSPGFRADPRALMSAPCGYPGVGARLNATEWVSRIRRAQKVGCSGGGRCHGSGGGSGGWTGELIRAPLPVQGLEPIVGQDLGSWSGQLPDGRTLITEGSGDPGFPASAEVWDAASSPPRTGCGSRGWPGHIQPSTTNWASMIPPEPHFRAPREPS